MKKRRRFFGPSKDEIWSQIAKDIDGEFIEGGFWGEDLLLYKHGEWQILLDSFTIITSAGTTPIPITYTRMRAPFINKDGLYFKIYREGFFSTVGKLFGMQDILTGDPFFDKEFIIKGNNPEKIRLLLNDAKIRKLCQEQPDILFEIKDDEGWLGPDFPEGVDQLSFQCGDVITKTALLKSLFELFSATLERLVQIDSAYEDDPKVELK